MQDRSAFGVVGVKRWARHDFSGGSAGRAAHLASVLCLCTMVPTLSAPPSSAPFDGRVEVDVWQGFCFGYAKCSLRSTQGVAVIRHLPGHNTNQQLPKPPYPATQQTGTDSGEGVGVKNCRIRRR